MTEHSDIDIGLRRWADQMLFEMKNEFTGHVAREETRDAHYQEAIKTIHAHLNAMRADISDIKSLIEQGRGTAIGANLVWRVGAWVVTGVASITSAVIWAVTHLKDIR